LKGKYLKALPLHHSQKIVIDNDEVMSIDNERYYLTTELETRHLKAFMSKLKAMKLDIELAINEKEN